MASGRATLKASTRSEFGSRESRRLRRQGLVPGVVYANGEEARPFQVQERDARAVLSEGHALFDLEIEGVGAVPVVVKEQQRQPVRGDLEHLDLQEVKLDEAIQAEVPIEVEGAEDAPGTKEGGVLEHITREVTVEALPTEIPDRIVIDVSHMDINDTIQLSMVTPPQGATFVAEDLEEVTVATLTPPRLEKELEEIEEEAALVGEEAEELEEGEEIPEGEEVPEGEEAPAEGEEEGAEAGEGDSGEEG
jgi:large subunit ribosomal protein L25